MTVLYPDFDCLITFSSVHQAIAAERNFKRASLAHAAMPTPREISVSCGQCLVLERAELDRALKLLEEARLVWNKVFARDARQRIYEEIIGKGVLKDADA